MSDLEGLNLEPGRLVGGYTLIEPLGGGAMGSVWRARDDGGQDYAMKILRESLTEDDQDRPDSAETRDRASARERLRREALSLKRINHPGVCQIVDMELDDALAFIVTELIEGRNLRDDVAANGPYTGDDLERLTSKMIDAVRAVHRAGIVHRDIKPTNVMISASGPVLVDFGIAMGQGESHVTRTGLVMGTPGFIAPEIIDGAESDQGTDWWSTAAVLAFAATGKPVFGSKPMMAVLEREASGNADLSGLPLDTMKAFRSALSPDRDSRCSPEDLLGAITRDAMDPAAGGSGIAAGDDPAHQPTQDQSTRKEGVRPFGASSSRDDSGREEPTQVVEPATQVVEPATPLSDPETRTLEAGTLPLAPDAGTSVIPAQGNPRMAWSSVDEATATLDTLSSDDPEETTRLGGTQMLQTHAFPQEVWDDRQPQSDVEDAQATSYQGPPLPAASPLPREDTGHWLGDQPQAQEPPALIRQTRYLHAGTAALVIIGFIPALMALVAPVSALVLAWMLMWFLGTAGLSLQGQINRELKRGGQRKGHDRALNVAALPWHLLKALLLSLPRILILALVVLAIGALATWLGGQTTVSGYVNLGGHLLRFPLPAGAPLSLVGLTMGLATMVGWLSTVLVGETGPGAKKAAGWAYMVRLGAGWLPLGAVDQTVDPDTDPQTMQGQSGIESATSKPRGHRRAWTMALVWVLVLAAVLTLVALHPSMDWSPIPILHS